MINDIMMKPYQTDEHVQEYLQFVIQAQKQAIS